MPVPAPLGMRSSSSSSAAPGSRPCAVLGRARRRGEEGAGGREQDLGSTRVSVLPHAWFTLLF